MKINGSQLIRIVAESVLRGGVRSIPFIGSGVDQATFGIKDAICNREVMDLLERILRKVNEIRPSEKDLTDQEINVLLGKLSKDSEIREIENQIQNINLSTLRELARVSASIQALVVKRDAIDFDVKAIKANVISGNQEILKRIEQSVLFSHKEYTRIQDSLSYISSLLIETHQRKKRNLREIYNALNELNIGLLDLSGYSFRVALESLPVNKHLSVTVDFSEIYRYSFSPYLEDPLAPLSVYLMHNSKSPLFLLPGTAIEMDNYLSRQLSIFVDRKKLVYRLSVMLNPQKQNDLMRPFGNINIENLKFLANLTMHENSPLQRMKRLSATGRVKYWNEPIPDDRDWQEYMEVAFKYLCNYRPSESSRYANLIDSKNLSLLGFLNAHANSSQPKFIHVSGAKSMELVGRKLSETKNPDFGSDNIPLVFHPLTWSYREYIPNLNDHFEHHDLIRFSKDIEQLSFFVRRWIDRLKKPSWDEMPILSKDLSRVYNSLVSFRPAVEPFHRMILETEIADLSLKIKPFGTTLWEQEFNRVIDETIEVIFDLLSHVQPIVYELQSFAALAKELGDDNKEMEA